MQARPAYIASFGTAAVMLGISLSMFALLSAFIAFGSWPGAKSARDVDQVVLADASTPKAKAVAVRSDAVAIARAEQRRAARLARERARVRAFVQTPAGNQVAQVPAGTGPGQGTTGAGAGGGTTRTGAHGQTDQPADVTKSLDDTTQQVTTQVQQQAQNVQTQVNQVVDQIIGPAPNETSKTVNNVTDTAGSLLPGH